MNDLAVAEQEKGLGEVPRVFMFESNKVRVVEKDGEPWWVLADVCWVLGLGNASAVAGRLEANQKSTINLNEGGNGAHSNLVINEPGLYSVIFRSDKPEAKRFQSWVCGEVLPQIRKTGSYGQLTFTREQKLQMGFEAAMELVQEQKAQIGHLQGNVTAYREAAREVIIPHMELSRRLAGQSAGIKLHVSQVAKLFDMGRNTLFKKLREWGWVYKQTPEPIQTHINRGETYPLTTFNDVRPDGGIKPHTITLITYKGMAIALKKLVKDGTLEYSEKIKAVEEAIEDCLSDGDNTRLKQLLSE